MKRIRDPIHGFIVISDDELKYLQDPLVQRLRRIKQLGFDHYVYPGATHDRFSHSLGVLHVASRIIDALRLRGIKLEAKPIRLAALTHDLGHTPLSHTLEIFLQQVYGVSHEAYTLAILEGRGREFADVLKEQGLPHNIISSEMDADRMDYLLRDSYYCGVKYGQFDLDRVIQGITAEGEDLAVLYKARYALQSFVLARFQMYLQVYMHKTSAGFSVAAARLMKELNDEHPYPSVDEVRDDPNKLVDYDDLRFLQLAKERSKKQDMLGVLARQLINRERFKIVFQIERTMPHKYSVEPYEYKAILRHRELIEQVGGLVHAPEFSPLKPPYKDGKSKLLVKTEEGLKDIREMDPILDTLSSHYTLIVRVYAIEGYEEEVRKVLKELGLSRSLRLFSMPEVTINILVDNNEPVNPEVKCAPAPGLSLLLDRGDFSVLFDTGPDKLTLEANADRMEIDWNKIKALVISHNHRDHTGGIEAVFERRPDLPVYLPEEISVPFAEREVIKESVKLMDVPGGELRIVHDMGEYKGMPIPENALVLVDEDRDAYIFCGCCHIGATRVVKDVKDLGFEPVFIAGGLHLIGKPMDELEKIAETLVEYGIEIAMPIHCSGYGIVEALDKKGASVIIAGVCSQVPLEYRP